MDNSLQLQLKQNNIIEQILDKFDNDVEKALQFRNTLISIAVGNPNLKDCSAQSILQAAFEAVDLGLSINPKLGQAYVVPYKSKDQSQAQLQISYKGRIQLAQSTGLYKHIHNRIVYEGEILSQDFQTGEYKFGSKISDTIIGYYASFTLKNGFFKDLFMTVDEIKAHAEKYSKTYKNQSSIWQKHFDEMAQKTVLLQLLSKYAPQAPIVKSNALINFDEEVFGNEVDCDS